MVLRIIQSTDKKFIGKLYDHTDISQESNGRIKVDKFIFSRQYLSPTLLRVVSSNYCALLEVIDSSGTSLKEAFSG